MARRAVRGSDAHMNVDEFASLWSRPDDRPPSLTIANGRWFDGRGFDAVTMHTVDGRLSRRRPRTIDGVVDLAGMYVVPPFGEAHNHNLHSRDDGAEAIRRYLAAGVFYVLIANNLPTLARGLRPMLNTPTSVDAVFAHGGLTASDGHPIALYERLAEQALLSGFTRSQLADEAYYVVDSVDELVRKWPRIMSRTPDLIKTFLLFSEERDQALQHHVGLDPAILPEIVRMAHQAGLRVAVHVETAADFHYAVCAGVNLVAHLPGHSYRAGYEPATYEISPADARSAGDRGVIVVTTGRLARRIKDPDRVARALDVQRHNIRLLLSSGVRVVVGSDDYSDTSLGEANHLHALDVLDNLALLRMWCCDTPRAIFPDRRIGELADGYEASFLALAGNPLDAWHHVTSIRLRVKQGRLLNVARARASFAPTASRCKTTV